MNKLEANVVATLRYVALTMECVKHIGRKKIRKIHESTDGVRKHKQYKVHSLMQTAFFWARENGMLGIPF